jgi:hypothetical protein
MKKIILFIGVMLLASLSYSQAVKEVTLDTLDNTNVKTSQVIIAGSSSCLAITAKCTQLGGTSDGTLVLKASIDDVSYQTITSASGIVKFYPTDTHTITNGSVWNIVFLKNPWKFYKIVGTGTANDTTLVSIKYTLK